MHPFRSDPPDPPDPPAETVGHVARDHDGLTGIAERLRRERSHHTLITTADGSRFVLKFAGASESVRSAVIAVRSCLLAVLLTLPLAACTGDDPATVRSDACLVRLHGKGDDGADPALDDGVAVLSPRGNGEGWGDREWRYADADALAAATAIVVAAVDEAGCERAVAHGFSSGASFAAALACRGDDLDGRLVGVVIDDPVTDAATAGCRPPPDLEIALYWTGALEIEAPTGTDCESLDWTCAGGRVRGIDAFAADLGAEVTPSPFAEHRRYDDAPEIDGWLRDPAT